jgi:hypothetical protein
MYEGSSESTTEVSDIEDASKSDAADMAGWLKSRLRLKRSRARTISKLKKNLYLCRRRGGDVNKIAALMAIGVMVESDASYFHGSSALSTV